MGKSGKKSYKFHGVGNRKAESQLRWLLRFINDDLVSLDPRKFKTLFRELLGFFYGVGDIDISKRNSGVPILIGCVKQKVRHVDNKHNREALGQFQRLLRHYMSLVMEKFNLSFDFKKPVAIQDYRFVKFPIEHSVELNIDRLVIIPESHLLFRRELRDLLTKQEKLFSDTIVFSAFVDNYPARTIQASTSNLLAKFPLSTIRLCGGCLKRYYYVSGRKKRQYCEKCVVKERVSNWRNSNKTKRNEYERNRYTRGKERKMVEQEQYEGFLRFKKFMEAAKKNNQDTKYVGPQVNKIEGGWKTVDGWLRSWSIEEKSLYQIWEEILPEIKTRF
jgi:hypothetical protein